MDGLGGDQLQPTGDLMSAGAPFIVRPMLVLLGF